MDEPQLESLRLDPAPAFASRLRGRLSQPEFDGVGARRTWPLGRIAAGLTAAAAIGVLVSVPETRASAQSFLAMFRQVNFVAVSIDAERFTNRNPDFAIPKLVGERVQILEESGPPTTVLSVSAASAAAGFDARVPARVPADATIDHITVSGRNAARITADADRLRQVMAALGIDDIDVPDSIDGQVAIVRVLPMVMIAYEQGTRSAELIQGPVPEVSLPAGLDLPRLGEIGLRILGLPPVDAHAFAQSVDWRNTLLVPVPPTAARFRHVIINGSRGLVVEGPHTDPESGIYKGNWNLILWSSQGRVYGIKGTMRFADVLEMANSIP